MRKNISLNLVLSFLFNRCYFIQLATVLYKCGLEALRELFQRIHPSWNNEPEDIRTFERGELRLDEYERSTFETGNIDKWDIALMSKVLLCSKVTKQTLEQEQGYQGYKDAITSIKEIKNKMLSHNNSVSIKKHAYETSIESLRRDLLALGFNGQLFEDTLKGMFSRFLYLCRLKGMIRKLYKAMYHLKKGYGTITQ